MASEGRVRAPDDQPLRWSWPPAPAAVVDLGSLPPQPPPHRIKVLHIITRFWAGSGGNTLLSATGMDPDRYEVWIAAAPAGPLWAEAEAAGLTTVRLPEMRETIAPADDLRTLWRLFWLIRRERFSVVHTHCSKAGFVGRLAARLAGAPVIVHTFHLLAAHSYLPPSRRRLYRALEWIVRPMADRYLAVAPRVAREAVETRIARAGTVRVVPSAVDLGTIPDVTDPTVRAELGIADDVPIVGWVGRIVAQKAPLDFVRMAAIVKEACPQAAFVMVGDASDESAPLEDAVRNEADRLGLPILFTGFRPDAPRLASAFDVYVVSSLYEGLGRGLTEAMAAGRPIVATDVNGVRDVIEPGSTGLLSSPGAPASLAANVLWMLSHRDEAKRMGSQAQQRVRGMFDQATMCELLDRTYCELLGLPEPVSGPLRSPGLDRSAAAARNGDVFV